MLPAIQLRVFPIIYICTYTIAYSIFHVPSGVILSSFWHMQRNRRFYLIFSNKFFKVYFWKPCSVLISATLDSTRLQLNFCHTHTDVYKCVSSYQKPKFSSTFERVLVSVCVYVHGYLWVCIVLGQYTQTRKQRPAENWSWSL